MKNDILNSFFSLNNKHNPNQADLFGSLYKYHKLFYETKELSESEESHVFRIKKREASGYYILNPYFVKLVINNAIWFSPAINFNDPWDAGAAISIIKSNKEIEKHRQLEEQFKALFSVLRFACFSKEMDNNPMWAHYGDNHKGVCLNFRFLSKSDITHTLLHDKFFLRTYPVNYNLNYGQINDLEDLDSAIKILFTKHPSWSYEKEVRFIKKEVLKHQKKVFLFHSKNIA